MTPRFTIFVHKAYPIRPDEPTPSANITISKDIDTGQSIVNNRSQIFVPDAENIVNTLFNSLPGGTFDQVLVQMLQRRSSNLIVPSDLENHYDPS